MYIGPLILSGRIIAALIITVIKLLRLHNGTEGYNDSLNTQPVLLCVFLFVFGFIGVGVWALNAKKRSLKPARVRPKGNHNSTEKTCFILTVIISLGSLCVSAYYCFTGFDILIAVICVIAADVIVSICVLYDRHQKHKVAAPQILLTLLIAASIVAPVGHERFTSDLVKPLNDHIEEYRALYDINWKDYNKNGIMPPLGKVVVVNVKSDSVFKEVYFAIPEKFRAATHEEVDTVIQVDTVILFYPGIGTVGTYTNDAIAGAITCEIQAYDFQTGRCLRRYRLIGGSAPDKIQQASMGRAVHF